MRSIMPTDTFQLINGYDRKKQEKLTFRNPSDTAEMIQHCSSNSHIWFQSRYDNTAKRCKINGKVRTWKRNPSRVEVPVKYGLYEYATFTELDIKRILIPV